MHSSKLALESQQVVFQGPDVQGCSMAAQVMGVMAQNA
jgi:hypothetical protein